MRTDIASVEQVRAGLNRLSYAQMHQLARKAGVPFTTLWKIRSGETENPGLETVRKFLPHAVELISAPSAPAVPEKAEAA